MRIDRDFLRHRIRVRAEGFEPQKLLSACLKQGILVKHVRFENDLAMSFTIAGADVLRLKKLTGSRYRLTALSQKGAVPFVRKLFAKSSTIAGLLIFAGILFYQGQFVSEIRIYGYEHLQESEIRAALAEEGLREGAGKQIDLNSVENAMYAKLDNLSWIGIKYTGSMAEVQVVEGKAAPEKTAGTGPAHVVAEKEGYIESVIPREGLQAVSKGAFVKNGDVVISGLMPIRDTTYEQGENAVRAVHAEGEVWARILYSFTRYQPRYELIKQETGRQFYGLRFQMGALCFDSSDFFWPYDSAVREEKTVFSCLRPLPVRLSVTRLSEVELYRKERGEKEIGRAAEAQSRSAVKENLPEKAQIIKNSLKFSAKENIIEVIIMLHSLEEIGKEQNFEPPAAVSGAAIQGDTGGTAAFGESE